MRYLKFLLLYVVLVSAGSLSVAHNLSAMDLAPQEQARFEAILNEMMSPYCAGRSLRDCPSSAAGELKDKIRERVHGGESDQKILDWLFSVYGDEMRALPAKHGFGLLAWLTPAAFLLLGLGTLLTWLSFRRHEKLEGPSQPLDTEMIRRIEAEIKGE